MYIRFYRIHINKKKNISFSRIKEVKKALENATCIKTTCNEFRNLSIWNIAKDTQNTWQRTSALKRRIAIGIDIMMI